MTARPLVPVSVGELLDKVAILRIKAARVRDPAKLRHVRAELAALEAVPVPRSAALPALEAELRAVNEALWDVEDAIRALDARGDFGPAFVALAQAVYRTNDRRAALKRAVNDATGSALVEVKSYGAPGEDPGA